jgi:hypothetical protein
MEYYSQLLRQTKEEYDELMQRKIIRSSDAINTLYAYINKHVQKDPLVNHSLNVFRIEDKSSFLSRFFGKKRNLELNKSKMIDKQLIEEIYSTKARKDVLIIGTFQWYHCVKVYRYR